MEFQVNFDKDSNTTTATVTYNGICNRFPEHRKPEKSLDEAKKFIRKRITEVLDEIKIDEIPLTINLFIGDTPLFSKVPNGDPM